MMVMSLLNVIATPSASGSAMSWYLSSIETARSTRLRVEVDPSGPSSSHLATWGGDAGEPRLRRAGWGSASHGSSSVGHTIGREKKYDFMLSDIFLRLLLANVLRPRQKPSPKERAGAGVNRTPLLQVTTRGVVDLDSERARGALPAGPAASEGGTAHKELLKAVRIVRGG